MASLVRISALIWLSLFAWHKYYVSVTLIQYKPESRKCEIILYTFPDDVALAVKKNFQYEPDWDGNDKKAKFFLETYLREHFSIKADDKELNYRFLGYTFEGEKMLLLMETDPMPEDTKQVEIRQTWLTGVYPEQKNLVHFITGHDKQSDILDAGHPVARFVFKP